MVWKLKIESRYQYVLFRYDWPPMIINPFYSLKLIFRFIKRTISRSACKKVEFRSTVTRMNGISTPVTPILRRYRLILCYPFQTLIIMAFLSKLENLLFLKKNFVSKNIVKLLNTFGSIWWYSSHLRILMESIL